MTQLTENFTDGSGDYGQRILAPVAQQLELGKDVCDTVRTNKTRQGYVRKHILKPAGYFFVAHPSSKDVPW